MGQTGFQGVKQDDVNWVWSPKLPDEPFWSLDILSLMILIPYKTIICQPDCLYSALKEHHHDCHG